MTLIIFVVILAILIISHELGHFLLAKWAGARVDEFGLGFPPRIWGYKKGETIYSINWLPFGGFVKIFGEDPNNKNEEDPRSLSNKPRWKQALVLVAGVTFNAILAWIFLTIGFATVGLPVSTSDLGEGYHLDDEQVTIVAVMPDSPATDKLKAGDKIDALTIGAKRVVEPTIQEIQSLVKGSAGAKVVLEYERAGKMEVITLEPKQMESGLGIGVALDQIGTLRLPLFQAITTGLRSTGNAFLLTIDGFYTLFSGLGRGDGSMLKEVAGPVGIVGLVGEASRTGWASLILFTSILSVNLAVLNLIPFPALDGGRLAILGIEAIIRRKIKPTIVNNINLVGFSLLLILMLVVTFSDITKLF